MQLYSALLRLCCVDMKINLFSKWVYESAYLDMRRTLAVVRRGGGGRGVAPAALAIASGSARTAPYPRACPCALHNSSLTTVTPLHNISGHHSS